MDSSRDESEEGHQLVNFLCDIVNPTPVEGNSSRGMILTRSSSGGVGSATVR